MLSVACDRCGNLLTEPGALVFSPPQADCQQVEKYHLCVSCWAEIGPGVRRYRDHTAARDGRSDPQ
jgi:hypothetical protein